MTKTLDEELLADAALQDVSPDTLARITTTAHQLRQVQHRLSVAEKAVEELAAEARRLSNELLPSLMDEAGTLTLTLDDHTTVTRTESVYASLAKDKREVACAWLCKHGYDGLVKNAFAIQMPRGSTKEAARVAAVLKKAKVRFEFSQTVHPQTLLAFVKESLEAGRKLPPSITYHVQPTVVVKIPKEPTATVTNINSRRDQR